MLDSPQAGPKAIRGGALRVAGFGAAVLISVGSSALLFRHLGVVAAGHYVTILSLVTLTGGLTDAGLSAIGVRELATRDRMQRRPLMRSLTGVRMTLSVLGILVALAFSAIVGYGRTLILGTLIAGTGMLLTVMQDTYAIPLTANLRLGWVAAADLLRQVVTALGIVALVTLGASLLPFWATAIPAGCASVMLTSWLVRREVPLLPSFQFANWRDLLRDTLPYALATAVGAAYFRVGILIVSLVAPGNQTGYFGVSFRVIEVAIVIPQLLIGGTFPIFARAARNDRERLSYALGRMFDTTLILGVGAALSLVVGAPFVISVIAGHHFGPAEPVLRIQGVALMASFLAALCGYALVSMHRHREILLSALTALVVSLTLTSVLASIAGARGAAVATTVTECVFTLVLGLAVYRTGVRPRIGWAAVPRVAGAAAAGALTLLIPGLADVIRLALALAIYGLLLLLLNGIPAEILNELPRPLRRAV